jgi:hypothetical protein
MFKAKKETANNVENQLPEIVFEDEKLNKVAKERAQ